MDHQPKQKKTFRDETKFLIGGTSGLMELNVIGEANVSVSLNSCVFVKLVTVFFL